jgi:phosphoglycerol transferase MdoB-like AlkP superfamily enzyme
VAYHAGRTPHPAQRNPNFVKSISSLVPQRYRLLLWVLLLFLSITLITRLGLLVFEADGANFAPATLLVILAVGLLNDLAAFAYVLIPFALLALVLGNGPRRRRLHAVAASALLAAATFGFLFTALAEGTFWNEFSSRFNFIAVDYLVYTREVIGNIWQSYPLGWLLGGIGLLTVGLLWVVRKPFWRAASAEGGTLPTRLLMTVLLLALPAASFLLVDGALREHLATPSERELASDGYYEFMRAFRSNDLDYFRFYKTLPQERADTLLRQAFQAGDPGIQFVARGMPAAHAVVAPGPASGKHVVLVSIESLGSDYVQSFGGKQGLTPNLDRLAGQGMTFTQLYATGLRTVRGLEAITLSIPPTPGHAVPVRKHNAGLQSLGGVLKQNGYKPIYLYGGYSYFDNMKGFFSANGYDVVDRTDVADADIHHETVWGIADEDIFRHAIKVIGTEVAAGQKVFVHIMTTSNHRPFTYPDGRVDIPSGSGRDGAVKYTDWAIGDFMREAGSQPWFKDTVFVFLADHTSHGRGRTDLPPENYRIPMIIYSPGFVPVRQVTDVASQIDLAPTLLALLNVSYTSEFFGQDILVTAHRHPRAFMANYLTVGYLQDGNVVELTPKKTASVADAVTGADRSGKDGAAALIDNVVAYYQTTAVELLQLEARDLQAGIAPAPVESGSPRPLQAGRKGDAVSAQPASVAQASAIP